MGKSTAPRDADRLFVRDIRDEAPVAVRSLTPDELADLWSSLRSDPPEVEADRKAIVNVLSKLEAAALVDRVRKAVRHG